MQSTRPKSTEVELEIARLLLEGAVEMLANEKKKSSDESSGGEKDSEKSE